MCISDYGSRKLEQMRWPWEQPCRSPVPRACTVMCPSEDHSRRCFSEGKWVVRSSCVWGLGTLYSSLGDLLCTEHFSGWEILQWRNQHWKRNSTEAADSRSEARPRTDMDLKCQCRLDSSQRCSQPPSAEQPRRYRCVDQPSVTHDDRGLGIPRKEWGSEAHYAVDEPLRHTEWKKSVPKHKRHTALCLRNL